MSGDGLVDRGLDRPAAFAGIRNPAGKAGELGILGERIRGQVQQPRGDDTAASPQLGDVGQVEVVLIVLGVAQRRGLGVDRMRLLADIGRAQNAETFGIGRHQPVFDAVVHHLDEMAGAVWPAMQIALLGRAGAQFLASRRGRDVAPAGGQGRKNRIETLNHRLFAADHHAVAALQPPHPAAGPDIDIVDPPRHQLLGAPDIVDVVGIAAVDQDVVRLEGRQDIRDGLVDNGRRHHQPDHPRLLQLFHQIG